MKHQTGEFVGVRNLRVFHQCWLPDTTPRAVLVIVHGLSEHSGRYGNIVRHFLPLNFAVYGLDHIGHGRSEGYRKFVVRFEDYIQNLNHFVNRIQAEQPRKPLFLIGHSMGGLIGATYLLDNQDKFTGAILSGPSVKIPGNISPAFIFLGKCLSILMPKIGLVATDPTSLSRDPNVARDFLDDPLVAKEKATARLGAELLRAMRRVEREAGRIRLPVLILQAGSDKLVSPAGATMLYDRIQSTDKEIRVYPELYHEIFNEPEHPEILGKMARWIEKQL